MPLIITATDFSDVATNAVNYACSLAQAVSGQVVIIHSYSIPLMFSDVPMPVSYINDTQHDAETHIGQLAARMRELYPGVSIKANVVFGEIIDAIEDYSSEHEQPWMIVVGNSTANGSTWPNSTLIDAFKKLRYPVLAVPPGATYQPVKDVIFAFDNKHSGNVPAMVQLADIIQHLGATLTVLNIVAPGDDTVENIDPAVKSLLLQVDPIYKVVSNEVVEAAIENYIDGNNNIGMLTMIPRKHSFFEGLFHKSRTKAVALKSNIPILALHDTKE